MTDIWLDLARDLANELDRRGVLGPEWRQAFQSVPRHLFVPRFYRDDGTIVDRDDPTQHAEWLGAVYSDITLITQVAVVPGSPTPWPTSSSTAPGLMARMLDLLDITDDSRVLEIGTGTGYNAALLCHRLRDTHVASVDIDARLVDLARERLAGLGHRPYLHARDGATGAAEHAPYDRIIATAAVPTVPPAWITQLGVGGLIVADIRGDLAGSLWVARKTTWDTVSGRFLATPGHFMWLREQADHPLRSPSDLVRRIDYDDADGATTTLDPAALHDPGLQFTLQLHNPMISSVSRAFDRHGTAIVRMWANGGSWAEATTSPDSRGRYYVSQGGPRRIWADAEHAATVWSNHGRPTPDRFGATARADGTRTIWLDEPTNPVVGASLKKDRTGQLGA